nr:four helix bundle suffix domain-containing protein [Tichowtungia aerotolerans]
MAQLAFDVTVRLVEKYIDRFSRTRDQMVQAGRSGVQNIAEASQASGTSKETELKLTNVARASLEELRLDDEDFLRQRRLAIWEQGHPLRQELVDRRCTTADEVAQWVRESSIRSLGQCGLGGQDGADQAASRTSMLSTKLYPEFSANAALVLVNVACALLSRQLQTLEKAFLKEGGLRERMTRARIAARDEQRRRR